MNLFTRWKDKATDFVDVRVRLLKLSFIERTSTLLGNLMLSFIALFIALAFFIFLGVALLELFADLLDSRAGGAFLTAGVFALMLGSLLALRKTIIASFAGIFIRILTEQDEDDEEGDKHSHRVKVEGD
jgi:uncharacterized membrane protein YqjE